MQRPKKYYDQNHYCTIYHATSQWVIRSDTHIFLWHNVKKSVRLKSKALSITRRFQVFHVVLTLYLSFKHVKKHFKGEALLFQVNLPLLLHSMIRFKYATELIVDNLINMTIHSTNTYNLD